VAKVLRAPPVSRPALAAAVAGSTVLWTTSLVDWGWKIPVLPIATLILLATVLAAGEREPEGGAPLVLPLRIGAAAVAVAALVAIAIPFASTALIRQSQDDAREGDTAAALADARSAQNVEPGAATPRLQQALLLESLGDFDTAAAAAAGAAEREPTNWRIWLVRSRIAAERGEPGESLRFYREAKSLNPLSPVFSDAP
jgi:tetratricopeptide (TPR) repeat protein